LTDLQNVREIDIQTGRKRYRDRQTDRPKEKIERNRQRDRLTFRMKEKLLYRWKKDKEIGRHTE
jgi:hypothetical protein